MGAEGPVLKGQRSCWGQPTCRPSIFARLFDGQNALQVRFLSSALEPSLTPGCHNYTIPLGFRKIPQSYTDQRSVYDCRSIPPYLPRNRMLMTMLKASMSTKRATMTHSQPPTRKNIFLARLLNGACMTSQYPLREQLAGYACLHTPMLPSRQVYHKSDQSQKHAFDKHSGL